MNIGAIGYATNQGLGMLLRSFYDAGVVQRPFLWLHGSHTNHFGWYPPATPILGKSGLIRALFGSYLDGLDVLLAFETPFDWSFFQEAKARGVKTVLMTMYEWTPKNWPVKPDALLCPSRLDYDYFHQEFPTHRCQYIPVPVDPAAWKLRKKALHFVHNAGHVGHREHKGTRQFLQAIPLVQSDAQFTIRCQDAKALDSILDSVPPIRDDERVTIETGDRNYDGLFREGDVYVAPEKLNGLSLPLQEARAAGLAVMTTDRYPANTWLPKEILIPPLRYERACITRNYREFDEAIVDPKTVAECIDRWYGVDISALSTSGKEWADANSWKVLRPRYDEFFSSVCS